MSAYFHESQSPFEVNRANQGGEIVLPQAESIVEATLPRGEQRQHPRLVPNVAIPAMAGRQSVEIVNLSIGGAGLTHSSPLKASSFKLRFKWGEATFDDEVVLVASRLMQFTADGPLYASRVRFLRVSERSANALEHAMVALHDELINRWMSNLHGETESEEKPETPAPTQFIACRLRDGVWRRSRVPSAEVVVADGFVVASTVAEGEIRRMCDVYERLDSDGRRLMQLLAPELR